MFYTPMQARQKVVWEFLLILHILATGSAVQRRHHTRAQHPSVPQSSG